MATEEMENNPFGGDGSNWTLLYVIIFSIPFIFVAIAVYSTWHDRRAVAAKAKSDLETGRAAKMDRYWHPWKYRNEAEGAAGGNSSTSSARKKATNPGNLTVVTTTTAASPAAGATSRHPHSQGAAGRLTSPRGGGRKTSTTTAPITPWFAPPSEEPENPYRPAQYQQHPPRHPQPSQQQQSHQSNKRSAASPYLPRPTAPMHDETETFGDGSNLRYV